MPHGVDPATYTQSSVQPHSVVPFSEPSSHSSPVSTVPLPQSAAGSGQSVSSSAFASPGVTQRRLTSVALSPLSAPSGKRDRPRKSVSLSSTAPSPSL